VKNAKGKPPAGRSGSSGKPRDSGQGGKRAAPSTLARAIQELQSALGELRVIEEQLRFQHDELMMARRDCQLQRSRYRQLLDFIPDACFVTDAAGRVREANPAAADALNVDRESIAGRPLAEFVVEDQRSEFLRRIAELRGRERIERWQVEFKPCGDRPSFRASVNVSVVREGKRAVGVQWLMRRSRGG